MVENQKAIACEAKDPARDTSVEAALQKPDTTTQDAGVDLTSKSDSDISMNARAQNGSTNSGLHEVQIENGSAESAAYIGSRPDEAQNDLSNNRDARSFNDLGSKKLVVNDDGSVSIGPITEFPNSDALLRDLQSPPRALETSDLLAMADGPPEAIAKKPFIDSESLTPSEQRASKYWKQKPEQLQEVKRELNKHGREPQDVLVDAMKKSRVLGIGESHIWSANLGMITDSVAKLKAAGATHFAVELSQAEVDEILKTGKDSGLHHNKEEYVAMMLAARDAGLKVVGVDNRKVNNGWGPGNEHRDEGMAADIEGILKSDPKAKVVFVVGSNHLNCDGSKTSAAEILKDKLGKDQVTTTVASDNGRNLQDITENLNRPVAVRTQDAPELSGLPLSSGGQKYGQWDIVIAYPQAQSDPYYGPYEDRMPGKKK